MRWDAPVLALLLAASLSGCVSPGPAEAVAGPSPPPSPPQAPPSPVAPTPPPPVEPPAVTPTPTPAPPPPPFEADLGVTIDASAGPRGAAEPARIDRRFYGMNVADWDPEPYAERNGTFLAYLGALRPGVLRWPAGHTSQAYQWERSSGAEGADMVLTARMVEDFLALCREVGAEPLLAVNLKTGTAEAAADLVRYVNVERGHDVAWWQIGNEPDHRDGLTHSPEEYAERYVEFAAAMRAVDPEIRLVGGEIMTGAHVLGSNGAPDWMTPILERAGRGMDAVSWHYYPLDSGQPSERSSAKPSVEHLLQETAPDWRPAGLTFADELFPRLRELRDAHAPGAEIWVTEMAEDSGYGGDPEIVGRHVGALWTADALGRFAVHGPDAVVKFVFHSGHSHRFTLLDGDLRPRPAYLAYWLLAREWGDRVVDARSDAVREVAAHAALRGDGKLAVVLVNKMESSRDVALEVRGFRTAEAERWEIAAPGYASRNATINGRAMDLEVATEGVPARPFDPRAGGIRLPPLSATMLVLWPAPQEDGGAA